MQMNWIFFFSILWQQVNSASTGRRTRAKGRRCRCRATTATRSSTWCAPITAASPSPSATSTVTPSGASTACRTDPCASSIQSAFTHSFTFSIWIHCYANFLFFFKLILIFISTFKFIENIFLKFILNIIKIREII